METLIFGAITAFLIVLFTTPSLIKVSKLKHLVDEPGEDRRLHQTRIPTIGGIIIFAGVLFSYFFWFPFPTGEENTMGHEVLTSALRDLKFLVSSIILLFFVGIKDDIIGTAPDKKMVVHLFVAFILVMVGDIRITSMHGLFGVGEIPYIGSVLLSVFAYIVIVNAFNLIDGVDGLAAGIGMINALIFGTWFYLAGNLPLALLSCVLAGALLGFLVFNFSPAKVFMGDSGSLTIGLVISFLAIRAIGHDTAQLPASIKAVPTPIFAMGVLAYPLIDTLRVFFIRAIKGQSPFTGDNNHIHHRLLALGFKHRKVVLLLYSFNVVVVSIILIFPGTDPTFTFLGSGVLAALLAALPFFFNPSDRSTEHS